MISRALLDTGPLVALLRRREAAHQRTPEALKQVRAPVFTCWPVLTEAAWLLRGEPGAMAALLKLVHGQAVEILALDQAALPWISEFMDRYWFINAQLADAALMYLAQREGIDTILTLDRRDFSVYRTSTGSVLSILPDSS